MCNVRGFSTLDKVPVQHQESPCTTPSVATRLDHPWPSPRLPLHLAAALVTARSHLLAYIVCLAIQLTLLIMPAYAPGPQART